MEQSGAVVIIGGGVVGACSAYYLVQRGWQVVLLEKGEICSGASYGNAGLVVPSHSVPLASPGVLGKGLRWMLDVERPLYIKPRLDPALFSWLWRFKAACNEQHVRQSIPLIRDLQRASVKLYEEFASMGDMEFGFERRGMLMLFNTARGYEEGVREARLLAEYGIEFKSLDGAGVRDMEPNLLPAVMGGVFYPEDAHLIPSEFVYGVVRLAEKMGVRVCPNTDVFDLEASGGRITRVCTTRGDFEPAEVVLAGGSWSPAVARGLGLNLPIQPAKGYSITMKRPSTCPTLPLLLNEVRVAVTPMGDMLRLAGTLELAGLDLSINRRRVDAILKGARKFLGGLENVEVEEIWRGLRPCTPDGLPIIGRPARYENLILAAGHAMIGQSLGPITGKLVSQLVCQERPDIDIGPVGAERF